jgi:hypothetical protein
MSSVNEDYWYNQWHLDTETHRKLSVSNIRQIPTTCETSIYADTDSIDYQTVIKTSVGSMTIEEWYNSNIINGSAGETLTGHESVKTTDRILNYFNGEIYYTPVKRIIRHKVTKDKWKLKTKSGKEITITDNHSMIVFRDGIQLEVKPSDVLKTDKILVLKNGE